MKVDGYKVRRRLMKIWMECVRNYMYIKSVNNEMTAGRVE